MSECTDSGLDRRFTRIPPTWRKAARAQADDKKDKDEGEDSSEDVILTGHSAVFDNETLIGGGYYGFYEKIRAGAFAEAISEKQPVRCYFNHDRNWVLGYTANAKRQTLTLKEDDVGLWFECQAPASRLINDLVIAPLTRGDIDGCSFMFSVRDGGALWTMVETDKGEEWHRELTRLNLFDVGPVAEPAYGGTDVDVQRSAMKSPQRILDEEMPANLRDKFAKRCGLFADPKRNSAASQRAALAAEQKVIARRRAVRAARLAQFNDA